MADAKRCDRCKNFYMPDDIEMYGIRKIIMSVFNGAGDSAKSYDLCPKCSKELKIFMDSPPNKAELKTADRDAKGGEE